MGTKVEINKQFAEADVKILTGDIGLHYYAGYGGGRKSVLAGISSEETIRKNHSMLLHPNSQTGVLSGNPINEDMIQAAKLVKVDFILNVVTNSKLQLVKAFAGDLERAFYEGVKLVDEMYKVPAQRRADIVVISPGGHPYDMKLYQAHKAIDSALNITKRGGVIVLVAECYEGHGNEVFYLWMTKFKNLKEIEKEIKKHFVLGGHNAYYLMKALQRVHIILVSIIPDYYAVSSFNLKTARTVNDSLREAFEIKGKNAKVWVMPYGNVTFPYVSIEKEKNG
jgi:nickel-dependent lactate racemase